MPTLLLAFAGPALAQVGEPVVIADINPGEASSDIEEMVWFFDAAFFRANDGANGFELWTSDGTPGGTGLVIDLREGPPNGFPANIRPLKDGLYFTAYDTPEAVGSKVFRSDGTAAGTTFLVDTWPGLPSNPFGPPLPGNFTPFDDLILFTATDPDFGNELWRTDGTPQNTARVADLHPGAESSIPVGITRFGDAVYFAADDSVVMNPDGTLTFDRELFRSDGTEAGTFRVKDIHPGPEPSIPGEFTPFLDSLYFVAFEPGFGREIWKTDGTEAGTERVTDINPDGGSASPQELTRLDDLLVFAATDGSTGVEPWISDGTADGTDLLLDVHPAGDSIPGNFLRVGAQVFFTADDGMHGIELWVTDGTEAGTRLVEDINPGPGLSGPLELTAVGADVYFATVAPSGTGDGSVVTELWRSDGTEAGTELVWTAPGRSFGYAIDHLTLVGDQLLFEAPTGTDPDGFSIDFELYALEVDTGGGDGDTLDRSGTPPGQPEPPSPPSASQSPG